MSWSGHKMYAPFGAGVLVGPRAAFADGDPFLAGGGAVDLVDLDEVVWTDPPEREEAGSPNVVGAVALAAAVEEFERLGWEAILAHERDMAARLRKAVADVPGVTVLGPGPGVETLPVVSFTVDGVPPALVAARLSAEHAIGVRHGCFCAHPYLMHLFHVSSERVHQLREEVSCGDRRGMPGAVRISFGFYNTRPEVDAAVDALWSIQRGKWRGHYHQNVKSGEYKPTETGTDPAGWFSFD